MKLLKQKKKKENFLVLMNFEIIRYTGLKH